MQSRVEFHDLNSINLPDTVPYAVLLPDGRGDSEPLPLCLMLMGGGGSRQNLADCQRLFEKWWDNGSVPPMLLATPSADMSYYVEDPGDGVRWESFLADEFVPHLRAQYNVTRERADTAITGISMGGYGALKTAFSRPEVFGVVAAMQPMVEPGFHDRGIGERNRLHHLSGGPPRLIGPGRDPHLFEMNNPAGIARANANRIRDTGLAIYIEAGDDDFVNAHDGAEFLHRVLWDLDLSHEYRLTRGADHGGPTAHPRMLAMYGWTGSSLIASAPEESTGPTSREFLRAIRARLKPLRDKATELDETTSRRFGVFLG